MHQVMATRGHAGELVALDVVEESAVRGSFLEAARAQMAVGMELLFFPGRNSGRNPGRNPGRNLGRDPGRNPLLERPDVFDQRLDLIVGQFAFIPLHLALALFDGLKKLGIAHLFHFRGMKILDPEFLADGSSAFSIQAVADLAFAFVERCGVILGQCAGRAQGQESGDQNHSRERGFHVLVVSPFVVGDEQNWRRTE